MSGQEIQRHTEGELPEPKIFDLLSSIGNGENKALELIVMRPGVMYSQAALYREVMDHQAKSKRWQMSRSVPFRHCEYSLSPIGLVTDEALSPDGTAWGFQITEFGIQTGVPFAGLLLKWSYEHPEQSLYKMFGPTLSSSVRDEQTLGKKRAPETRYKILREIVSNPRNRTRQIDIAGATSEDNIGRHLVNLDKNGVLSYEKINLGGRLSYFRKKFSSQGPEQYRSYKSLSTRVYDVVTNQYLSGGEIASVLIQKYPEYESLDRKIFIDSIVRIATHFEAQGNLERQKFSEDVRTEITLSGQQRDVIVSLITAIDKFSTGDRDTIEEGRRFAQRVASDPNLFSDLMLKAKEWSPDANRTSIEDMNSYIISILYDYPNSTVHQIQQHLEEDYGKSLKHLATYKNLSKLVRQGRVASQKNKSGNVYRVVEEESKGIIT